MAHPDEHPLEQLVADACAGSQVAWATLVRRLERVVWKAVNMATSDQEAREDAFAWTWMTLSTNLASIREPSRLPGWLVTTATRRAVANARKNGRSVSGLDLDTVDAARSQWVDTPNDERLLRGELGHAIRTAFWQLDEVCRELLTLLVLRDPPMSYGEVEQTLDRPHGWVGPTRLRCLDKLRRTSAMRAIATDLGATP